ncbi:winged helix-turn-helix domain-containing protein [Aquirufa lenticrescens]|uniref:winged helix-turn-helix domain-containing protein n=1 Tax=Aquirufa lenticrescens TaxID=2696560 RepID=UPI001CAA6879|nr:transcriptional regulator [Aquirufa lenticrescens]UAJ14130.1 transcriptional regulator [Aquirufa lenticrescens]
MSSYLTDFNKVFESRVRLGMMSLLVVQEQVDFGQIKDSLQLSDGNLASHMNALEKIGYVEVRKQFIGKKPNTTYAITPEGKKAFSEHLNSLEKLIKQIHS